MAAPQTLRVQLTVHYDGSQFHGWQFQPDRRTVQGELQAAVSRLADRPRKVIGSGRTDTGVHATGQVAAVDLPSTWTPAMLRRSLNAILPRDIWIECVQAAAPDFHPRRDALARTYRYQLGTEPEASSPFHRRTCWPLSEPLLDRALLDAGALMLLGAHSFEAFAKSGQPERGHRCEVAAAEWRAWELGVRFEITADRYLHHMVRYLVGTMVDIALERRALDELGRLLDVEPGLTTSPPAPPAGLFLAHVEYPQRATPNEASRAPAPSTATA